MADATTRHVIPENPDAFVRMKLDRMDCVARRHTTMSICIAERNKTALAMRRTISAPTRWKFARRAGCAIQILASNTLSVARQEIVVFDWTTGHG